jgi:hypothetical protein
MAQTSQRQGHCPAGNDDCEYQDQRVAEGQTVKSGLLLEVPKVPLKVVIPRRKGVYKLVHCRQTPKQSGPGASEAIIMRDRFVFGRRTLRLAAGTVNLMMRHCPVGA